MAKKSRRQRRPNLPPEAFNTPSAATATANAPAGRAAEAVTASTPAQRRAIDVHWREEYSEVFGDLKRTAILAVILLATMGVLSVIIH